MGLALEPTGAALAYALPDRAHRGAGPRSGRTRDAVEAARTPLPSTGEQSVA